MKEIGKISTDQAIRWSAIANGLIALTSAATTVAAVLTLWTYRAQLSVMQSQLDVMMADQRPTIALSGDSEDPTLKPDGRVWWSYKLENSGKGVAYHVILRDYLKTGDGTYKATQGLKPEGKVFSEWPTNYKPYSTAVSQQLVSADLFSKMMQADNAVGILLEIEYLDAYNKHYSSAICLERLSTGAILFQDPHMCPKT